MPRNRNIEKANKNIQDLANTISANMDNLYRATYITSPQQSKDLDDLSTKINTNIDRIVNQNLETIGTPSVSKLYARLAGGDGTDTSQIVSDLDKMFNNGVMQDDIYEMFMGNRYLKEFDAEIDTVCRYMPELDEALEVQRDCVLSADHFSKDYLNFKIPTTGIDEKLFTERMKDIKKKYKLATLCEEIYADTTKYGEKFVYRVPYSTAIGKLLATKPDTALVAPQTESMREDFIDESNFTETYIFSMDNKKSGFSTEDNVSFTNEATMIVESTKKINGKNITEFHNQSILNEDESFKIGVEICKSNIIESAVLAYDEAMKKSKLYSEHSMANIHEAESKKDIKAAGNVKFEPTKKDDRIIATTANDGLIAGDGKDNIVDVKIPGCVVKKLNREQVIPIYIDDICMGYYYFEMRTNDDATKFLGFKNVLGDPLTNVRGDLRSMFNTVDEQRQDETIRYVANQLSLFIDKQFVNNNQDLAKEIYMILKYNDLFNAPSMDIIKVTFIPPEDMVHFFFNQDETTHRGISDLEKSMLPAKLYASLEVSSSVGNLTRGFDRRAYYVKNTVDTNIAQNLMNTINQIKQGNFGIRQFQNINNVLGIIGRYNDFVIPTNSTGDPPISFEVIPGQEIETPTDLMESLKDSAVSQTGIPYEIIQTRKSVDYAMQLSMSSSKVLRFCYKRQELYQELLSELISPIYNYEYDDSVIIAVTLPPPSFINVTNTNQLVDNTKSMVNSIVEVELTGKDAEDNDLKLQYTKDLFYHYIGTHIDVSSHSDILSRARLQVEKDKNESHTDGGDSDY